MVSGESGDRTDTTFARLLVNIAYPCSVAKTTYAFEKEENKPQKMLLKNKEDILHLTREKGKTIRFPRKSHLNGRNEVSFPSKNSNFLSNEKRESKCRAGQEQNWKM